MKLMDKSGLYSRVSRTMVPVRTSRPGRFHDIKLQSRFPGPAIPFKLLFVAFGNQIKQSSIIGQIDLKMSLPIQILNHSIMILYLTRPRKLNLLRNIGCKLKAFQMRRQNCVGIWLIEILSRRVLRLETDETDAGNELYTISNLGGVLWDLVGCNALTWVLLFLCMFRGVKSRLGSFEITR